ncbi:hypothetical protein HF086_003870 [Spodoptera exigua]|uniref:PX domain-containing protein n=1 Tax=Spodoptera exigua TaxID=7107 RepID=A0A922MRX2_SPOEX|nr:hypothetical protein HF086_003870 [Spodoptera exigua]
MHFSIPDLQQFHDDNGISYTGYNIHIDGVFHCTARYKQLLSLHEQLQAQNPYVKLPQFPPKKLFLTNSQLEERRVLLEKYMQLGTHNVCALQLTLQIFTVDLTIHNCNACVPCSVKNGQLTQTFFLVGQNPLFTSSDLLVTFLFSAQQETHGVKMHEVEIEISLMNGYRIPLSVSSTDSSNTILDIVCTQLNLPKELVKYFSLYLFNWSCAKDGQPALKKLEEYESPYISQKYVRPEDKIVLRKSYWDTCYDVDLMIDRVSLDLLYLQIIEDLDLGWITADPQTRDMLSSYKSKKQKREYVELAKTLRHYGRIPAGEAVTELSNVTDGAPEGTCRVRVSLASKELTLLSLTPPAREQRYKVTRMRCWRITTLHTIERSPAQNGHGALLEDSNRNFELSFEYLISKDNLKWITLRTEHATFISVCLQNGDSGTSGSSREIFSVQKLTEKFATVSFKPGRECVENNAFEAIGDEEL